MTATRGSGHLAGPLLIAAAMALTGTTGTAQALGPDGMDPTAVGALRLLIGGPALLAISYRGLRGLRLPWRPMLVAAVAMAAYQPFFFGGTARAGVAVGTIVTMASAPVFAGLLGPLLGRGLPDLRWTAATATAVVGVVLVAAPTGGSDAGPSGPLFSLGAGLSYAVFAHATKGVVARHPPTAVMAVALTGAALLLLPLLARADVSWVATTGGTASIMHLGLFATAGAYALYGRGLARVPVAETTTLSLVEPVVAALLGLLVLGERFTGGMAVGAVFVAVGLMAVGSSARSTASSDDVEPRPMGAG
ncbi:MAG: EamA family transporter [Actinomycetota bacterium]|nr:EamA family transporter [Actinomycetota bacterium]MEE2631918.1 EamA family transporter [Actinomycetota bacterium]